MKKIIFTLFLVCCVIAINCSRKDNLSYTSDENDIKEAVVGNTDFAFALYGKLKDEPNATVPRGEPNNNLFFSPYSLSTALAMTYAGARGNTEKQMAETLHFTLPGKRLHSAFGTLQKQIIQNEKSRGYQIILANALWGKKGEPFLKEFLDLNKKFYNAGLTLLDFVNETKKSRKIINDWVEEKMKEKIKNLIPSKGVDELTVLVITNAIYFKGEWKNKFEEQYTRRSGFYLSAKNKVEVDMMFIEENFKCYEDEKLQIVELPYKGDELSMMVLLPMEIEGIKELEKILTAEKLNTIISKMRTGQIQIYLPKFKIDWGTFSLNKAIIALGMPEAFDRGEKPSDFSGINGKGDIWISDVFHKAFIEVNEEGTEAAAGTAVVLTIHLDMVFRADHPFIFIIKDNRTGSILFMGRVMNPEEEN
jgi:serpin B